MTGPGRFGPIDYLPRIRRYYLTLGYPTPYQWAQFDNTPFTPLSKPLADCRVGLITTAAPYQTDKGNQGPGAPYNGSAKFFAVYSLPAAPPPDLRISHVGYDRQHTSAADSATWLPLEQLFRARAEGQIGSVSPNVYGLPTNRSQPTTIETDSPELLKRLQDDAVDVALLVPNCPVCHQSCSIAARHLEANGMATVVMGCAKDIVEHVGVPRLSFADFPLGNGAGRPHDPDSQRTVLDHALRLLASASGPNTTKRVPLDWAEDDLWKADFYNIDRLDQQQIDEKRAEFDRQKVAAKKVRHEL